MVGSTVFTNTGETQGMGFVIPNCILQIMRTYQIGKYYFVDTCLEICDDIITVIAVGQEYKLIRTFATSQSIVTCTTKQNIIG